MKYEASLAFAKKMDTKDPLKKFRRQFHFPVRDHKKAIYFCGNSLGLQPKTTAKAIRQELRDWKNLAVGGYFGAKNPWLYYHKTCQPVLANIMGCLEEEVTVMNALTVNLHLMLQTFYKPSRKKFRILMEAGAFPSDQYAIETCVRLHGFDPAKAIIEVKPRRNEKTLRTEDIIKTINDNRDSLAMLMLGGINYYTGQLYDIKNIAGAARAAGAVAGFDLAHVAGNVPMQLHDWEVDFAVWCSYKYLNAGPGSVSGVFIHQRHVNNKQLPRAGGWWGNEEKTRFKMKKGFVPKANADGWQLSTAQVFNTVALKASLRIFKKAGMGRIRKKSKLLTGYLEYLLGLLPPGHFDIITPADPEARGAQLSLFFRKNGRAVHDALQNAGVVSDFREPGVIRLVPAPLYNGYKDVFRVYEIIKTVLEA